MTHHNTPDLEHVEPRHNTREQHHDQHTGKQNSELYMTGMLIDEKTGDAFELHIHGDTINIYPHSDDIDTSSLLRFTEFVREKIDSNAHIQPTHHPDNHGDNQQ